VTACGGGGAHAEARTRAANAYLALYSPVGEERDTLSTCRSAGGRPQEGVMDTARMLRKCVDQQWKVQDLDWNVSPRPMSHEDEIAVVQYFTDMAEIERFAGALFQEQRRIVADPTMKKIFSTFVADEERHADVASRLADHYNVHKLKTYTPSRGLMEFKPHFLATLKYLSAEIANSYITGGELMLDVALLRSLDDYVHDEMSARAMDLINRDESRHIAVDYHMAEFYASPEYQAWLAQQPKKSLLFKLKAAATFANVLWYAGPFARQVFFEPMAKTDPSGKRLREAVKRMQLLGSRPHVSDRPFAKFQRTLREINNHPIAGPLLGRLARRLTGSFPAHLYRDLFTKDELTRANHMSMDELAEEAVQAKFVAV